MDQEGVTASPLVLGVSGNKAGSSCSCSALSGSHDEEDISEVGLGRNDE